MTNVGYIISQEERSVGKLTLKGVIMIEQIEP